MKHSSAVVRLLALILTAPLLNGSVAFATDCVVTNTSDSAASLPPVADSLRDCLERARSGDTITFDANIFDLTNSNAATTIDVQTGLPELDDGNVTIEASDRRVTVNGSGAGSSSGIVISSSSNTVRGLTITGFQGTGLRITSGDSNVIGGDRSVGTGPNGQGLRIAGNGSFGIEITGTGTHGNTVKGCWIGLDASGSSAQPNLAGIVIQGGGSSNTIGSVVAGEANVISGNTTAGVGIADIESVDNVVIGNFVGMSGTVVSSRRTAVGNGSSGVFLSRGTTGNHIGGEADGEGNEVAFNGGNGVEVRASNTKRNSARGNRITKNKAGGIALFDGSNDGIVRPILMKLEDAPPDGTGIAKLSVTVFTTEAGTVEVFNDSGEQGETLLGRGSVPGGVSTVVVALPQQSFNVTATFTDALGDTSAFGVFGLTDDDDDGDGVSTDLEQLAGTNPMDAADVPALGPLTVGKMGVKLNFAKADKDAIKLQSTVTLPPGFAFDGVVVGVCVIGHCDDLVLDAKGKAKSDTVQIALKTSTKTGATTVKYGVKSSALQPDVAPFGLTDRTTTPKIGDRVVVPAVVTVHASSGGSDSGFVYHTAVTLTYKATQGKSGKASNAK